AGARERHRAIGINPGELGRVLERLLWPRPRGIEVVHVAVGLVRALDDETRAVRRDRMTDATSLAIGRAVESRGKLRPRIANANREDGAAESLVASDRTTEVLRELGAVRVVIDDS